MWLWALIWAWPALCLAQDVAFDVEVVGLEGRPYSWSEILPLTGVARPVETGSIGQDGHVVLHWPDDGRMHTYRLQCAGVTWTLPVCGPMGPGHRLVPPAAGGAPFANRPGAMAVDSGAMAGLPLVVAAMEDAMVDIQAGLGAELQRAMLWGESTRRGGESRALGGAIGEDDAGGGVDSLRQALVAELRVLPDSFGKGQPAVVVEWMRARVAELCMDADPDSWRAGRKGWSEEPAPDPRDAAAVQRFIAGCERFAGLSMLPDSLHAAYAMALGAGDWGGFVSATGGWWGGPDPDRTAAWCAHRLGRDAFGIRKPGAPFSARTWPAGWTDLLDGLEAHPQYGAEVATWRAFDAPLLALPSNLRAFDAGQSLVDMASVVGTGPAVWLWIDAAAPSTTVQLEVLEKMMADPSAKRWPRGQEWVVADAGTDWVAFQGLVRTLAERYGGLSRMPFTVLHIGGDLRWVRAFDLSALPAVRQHGADRVPVAAELPLPGPELSRWLARRP